MRDLLTQPPFDEYFASPTVPRGVQERRKGAPRISGVGGLLKHLPVPEQKGGVFVAAPVTREMLSEAFAGKGTIRSTTIFKRYTFVEFEGDVNTESVGASHYNIGGRLVAVDRVRGSSLKFVPCRLRRRASLWHDYKRLK